MANRYLFGPVDATFGADFLAAPRAAGVCRTFDLRPGADFQISPNDSWWDFWSRQEGDWRPDFVVFFLQYRCIPTWVWQSPIPIIGLAGDWNRLWHHYRACLRRCDLVLTDVPGIEKWASEGIVHARPMCLFGLGQSLTSRDWATSERDIDILFVGNFHSEVQKERLAWLGRVASLGDRWNVRIATCVFGEEYANLLGRARIVFNRGIRNECNSRVGEAVVAGALLFQEADNREVPYLLREGDDYIAYTHRDLEAKLAYYLTHETERLRIAENARRKIASLSFEAIWTRFLDDLPMEWPALEERAAQRQREFLPLSFEERTWQAVTSSIADDPALVDDLRAAVASHPEPNLLYCLGLVESLVAEPDLSAVAYAFQRAWQFDPRHILAGLGLAMALSRMGQARFAIEHAERVLSMIRLVGDVDSIPLAAPPFPASFDHLLVDWERAAWNAAGDRARERGAKLDLIRWQLHFLIARLSDDLGHAFQARLLLPDRTDRYIGTHLAAKRRHGEAIPFLRQSLERNPFDRDAARALHECFHAEGLFADRDDLIRNRRVLSKAAPQLVPAEAWFASLEPPALTFEPKRRFHIIWQGTFDAVHSLAHVNRQIVSRLIDRGHELALQSSPFCEAETERIDLPPEIARCQHRNLERPDTHIRHHWPPDWTPPAAGPWVLIQPWEFGAIPSEWIEPLKMVDEIWVPSAFVRDSFLRSGVPAERVFVVPNGVALDWIEKPKAPYRLRTAKRFKFLFVGGTIDRKGIGALLKAYGQVFSAADDVCLVIKDIGVGGIYKNLTAEGRIADFCALPENPEIEYLGQNLSEAQMMGLYDTCDCLVHPFRGEGFALPIAEAMARGLPVIVTGFGPTLDYCDSQTAYLVPAQIAPFSENYVGSIPTAGRPFLVDPAPDILRYFLRFVFENPGLAQQVGVRARQKIRQEFTWDHTVRSIERRLESLVEKPVVRLAAALPVDSPKITTPGVSLCMIVKNEEANLSDCLRSVADLVDEIIIVDTGSSDRTKAVAQEFGAKVFDFPWIDNFAAARNESLRHAGKAWIFWMDADDRLDQSAREAFRRLRSDLDDKVGGYAMKCLCLPDFETGASTVVDHIRLFQNHPAIRWKYRIHEQILPSIRWQGGEVAWTDVTIHHVGYQDLNIKSKKRQRDFRLLQIEDKEHPDDPFTLFNLGQIHQEAGRLDAALSCFRRSLSLSDPHDSIVRKLHSLIAQVLRHQQQPAQALDACRFGKNHYPNDPELLFQEGLCRQDLQDWIGAVNCYQRVLEGSQEKYFSSSDPGLRTYKTRHNLGVIYRAIKNDAGAEAQWNLALAESPNFMPSLNALAELQLAQRRWNDLDDTIRRIRDCPSSRRLGDLFEGRRQLAMGNYASAQATFEAIAEKYPETDGALILLSQVLLQNGADKAAEATLRKILNRDPNHAEARKNLDLLLSGKSASFRQQLP